MLPMLGVDYRMPLSATGSAPAGRYDFDVAFAMPNGVKTLPVSAQRRDLVGRRRRPGSQPGLATAARPRVPYG